MAGVSAERQEQGLVNAIKGAVKSNQGNPITLVVGKTKLVGVIDAYKYTGRQAGGSEPYTDVVIKLLGNKELNCSLKGPSAPSLAGGGMKGLELAVPGIAAKFMKAAYEKLKDTLNPGDKVPDVYGKISASDKKKIVVGNKAMGGPIDYMYIGLMNVVSRYDARTNILTIQSTELIPSNIYAQSHNLYFRLRARREDQRFDPLARDKNGVPKIYGVSPSKKDSSGRIVVVDKVPATGVIINL